MKNINVLNSIIIHKLKNEFINNIFKELKNIIKIKYIDFMLRFIYI